MHEGAGGDRVGEGVERTDGAGGLGWREGQAGGDFSDSGGDDKGESVGKYDGGGIE